MEPLAPGTEDDVLYNQFNRPTKKETAEEQALSKKAFLSNGRYGNIYELNYVQGAQHWFCKVCDCPVMGRIFNHEVGKRHTSNMDKWNKKKESTEKDDNSNREENSSEPPIVIAPGEPVPPGFEGEIEKITQIQERLDGFNAGPLVGLEYLLELLDYDPSREPFYLCILCDKKGDPRTVLTHLSSYNHQLMYLQKHFPTVYRHIAPFMIKAYKRNWQSAVQKIAEAIESTFGRLKPMPVESEKFKKDRMHYLEIVAKGKHFNELSGHTFENVVTKEELTKVYDDQKPYDSTMPFKKALEQSTSKRKSPSPPVVARPLIKKQKPENKPKRKSLSPVSDISSSDLEDYDPKTTKDEKRDAFNRRFSPSNRRRSRSISPKRKEGPMPWQKSNYGRVKVVSNAEKKRDEKTEKMEEYRKLAKAIDNDMEQVLKKHKQNPEKHPKYNDEWKIFWNKRYKELQAEGKNASTHDFKPEWIEFWNKRMLELHSDEIKLKKIALRRRLGLPEEPPPISFKIGERRKPTDSSNKPVPTAAQPDNDPEVIVIEDNERDRSHSPKSRNRSKSPRKRDHSPQFRRRSPYSRRNSSPYRRDRDSSSSRKRRSPSLSKRDRELLKYSPPPRKYSKDRSPDSGKYRSRSRGRSREISWERERLFDEKPWERSYRSRGLPWEVPPWDHRYPIDHPYAPPKVMRDVTREPVVETTSTTVPPTVEEEDDGNVNIVAVLRLLTALEEKLGSLGPKVIELLGQALAMEKKVANSSEELLDNEINCVLFETVKEKLKGQLLAGFVERIQEKAYKKAITKTASLIHLAGERKKQREEELPKKPVVVPGVGTVDKGKIAKQIANALVAQGKTDVSEEELEQLINAVVGMAEAQKNSSEPITTATFLEKIAKTEEPKKIDAKSDEKPTTSNEKPQKVDEDQTSIGSQDKTATMNMEALLDSDLQILLQNFKDLSSEEQQGLINHLKKLEAKEPERVEKLRKFVVLGDNSDDKKESGRSSPFADRTNSINPTSDDKPTRNDEKIFIDIDSDEEEYSFDDVAKAASQKVIEKEMEKKRIEEVTKKETEDRNLTETKALISSLMSSLNKSISSNVTTNTEPKQSMAKINIISNVPVSSADIAKNLSGISMTTANLGNILGNVHNLTKQNQTNKTTVQENESKTKINQEKIDNSRNPYDDFSIDKNHGKPSNRPYDEFNIGPNPGEFKEDLNSRKPFQQEQNAPTSSNTNMINYPEKNLQYSMGNTGGFRGNFSGPSQSQQGFNPQFSPRAGGPLKTRPGFVPNDYRGSTQSFSNNFQGNFRSGQDDYRMNQQQGMFRNGPPTIRGQISDTNRMNNPNVPRYPGNFQSNNFNNSFKRW